VGGVGFGQGRTPSEALMRQGGLSAPRVVRLPMGGNRAIPPARRNALMLSVSVEQCQTETILTR
jgi:hypothetical protein